MTEKQENERAYLVCGRLCKYPGLTAGKEQLEEICRACPWKAASLRTGGGRTVPQSNYVRLAGTPERLASFLVRYGGAPDTFSLNWCRDQSCGARLEDGDFTCTDEMLRGCILRWLLESGETEDALC